MAKMEKEDKHVCRRIRPRPLIATMSTAGFALPQCNCTIGKATRRRLQQRLPVFLCCLLVVLLPPPPPLSLSLLFPPPHTHRLDHKIRCSIVVSISACHAGDPGSIPVRGVSTRAYGTPRGASPDPARALHKARPEVECFHSSAS